MTSGLERIGARLRFTEGLLGIFTALGADAPEVASACSALLSGHHDVGMGVVLGSNVFNLAALLGLSAVVAGRVEIGREGLLLNGGAGLLVTMVAALLIFKVISPWLSAVLLLTVLVPYVSVVALRPEQIQKLRLPRWAGRFFKEAVGHAHRDSRRRSRHAPSLGRDVLIVTVMLVVIIFASIELVRSAVVIAGVWGLNGAVMGTLVLAALTSIPNVIAAVRLALEGRGPAVVSESLNSNTINVVAGACLPALVFGPEAISGQIAFTMWWLLGMTLVALLAAGRRRGLHRFGGSLLIGLYLIYTAVTMFWS